MKTYFASIQRILPLVVICVTCFMFELKPAAAQAAPIHDTPIPCEDTPFGHKLVLGHEQELFVSINNTSTPQPQTLDWSLLAPSDTGQLHSIALADAGSAPNQISALAATVADLDGDGKSELVQGFTDSTGQYQLVAHRNGKPDLTRTETWPNHTTRALAAGDILGQDNGAMQVVIASRGADNVLNIAVYSETVDSGIGAPVALWRSNRNGRGQGTKIKVAVGNLDKDPYADIVVGLVQSDGQLAQMIYLEYQPNFQAGSGANLEQNLQERATGTYWVSGGAGVSPRDLQMILVDGGGGGQDRVALAWDQTGNGAVLSPQIDLRIFAVETINGTTQFVADQQATIFSNSRSFALATGDINGDHREEIVVGYDTNGNSSSGKLTIDVYELPTLKNTYAGWRGSAMADDALALAVGDFNKDGRAEIAAAFKDGNDSSLQILYFTLSNSGVNLSDRQRYNTNLNTPVTLSFGDWDNDSLRAVVRGKCAKVIDAHVTAADFIPPYWQNIQGDQSKSGSLGQSSSQEQSSESSLSYYRSDTVSTYVGLNAGASFFDLVEFSASARVTGAQAYTVSNRKTGGIGTTKVTTSGQSWNEAAVVYEPAEYKCYSYQMSVAGSFIDTNDARLRFCEYQALPNTRPTLAASELDSWDNNYGSRPEYVPVVRDWASLALFRDNFTTQSSNPTTAKLAVDSEIVQGSFTSGTIAQTNNEPQPWWQVDLGTAQDITKIRLWSPKGSLTSFYLFVSNNPFVATDKPTDLLARPDVKAYTLANLGNGWAMTDTAPSEATFLTLDAQHQPISGRYVRVQRADTAILALAEVQIFGQNHVEPDRYPIDLCDADALNFYGDEKCTSTPDDGYFMVKLYNPYHGSAEDAYVWKKVRGRILWDGRANAALNSKSVTRGNTTTEWSMSDGMITSTAQAKTLDNSTSIGTEFDVEGGVGIKVQAGRGAERTTGIASEVVQSTSWSTEVNMGGEISGFPTAYDGQENTWILHCRYYFQPYTYELTDNANLGYQHRYVALDYLVPDAGRESDLKRTRDLTACRNGNSVGSIQATADNAAALANTPVTLDVVANDQGNNLIITDIGTPQHGVVTHTDRAITYTSVPDFSGIDTFTYTVSDGYSTRIATITVQVTANSQQQRVYLPIVQR